MHPDSIVYFRLVDNNLHEIGHFYRLVYTKSKNYTKIHHMKDVILGWNKQVSHYLPKNNNYFK